MGTVRALWRYPVKSMAAERLRVADVSWSGVAGDRRWAFVRARSESTGFPWQTIRENPQMCRYTARLEDPERPDGSGVEVRSPSGNCRAVTDPDLAQELGVGVRVMRLHGGTFDAMPLSLITTHTVTALCALAGVPSDALRFRPNLLVEPLVDAPYAEDAWVGHTLAVGDAGVRVDRRDPRCVVVNVDPGTGRSDSDLLKVVGRERRAKRRRVRLDRVAGRRHGRGHGADRGVTALLHAVF